MKKLMMYAVGAMMAISLVACAPTEKEPQSSDVSNVGRQQSPTPETQEKEFYEKVGDPDAPVYEMAFVYFGNSDATGLKKEIEDVETLDAQTLVDLLIQYIVLDEGTTVLSFDIEGGEKAGPGVSQSGNGERVGTLNLSQIPEATGTAQETLMLAAIGNTFIENFELDKLKLLVNGENYTGAHIVQGDNDYLVYEEKYKDFLK